MKGIEVCLNEGPQHIAQNLLQNQCFFLFETWHKESLGEEDIFLSLDKRDGIIIAFCKCVY